MNKYDEIKNKHQKIVEDFPMIFAFTEEQLHKGMNKLELNSTDYDKIYDMGAGCYIRKTDLEDFNKMWDDIRKEHNDLIASDKTGDGYIKDMFVSELENHEYSYTRELDDTLDALELTPEMILKDIRLQNGLYLAEKEVLKNSLEEDYEL